MGLQVPLDPFVISSSVRTRGRLRSMFLFWNDMQHVGKEGGRTPWSISIPVNELAGHSGRLSFEFKRGAIGR